jgi:hypothetical protein
MQPCKAKLPDGQSCPNQVDDGQEYCPYHLASQNRNAKNILSVVGTVLGIAVAGVVTIVKIAAKRK